MTYDIYRTELFIKTYEWLGEREKDWILKISRQLKENPMHGKPLGRVWFREKKFEGKRLYFLVYQKTHKILLIAFAPKKEQQKIIDHILGNLEDYRKIVDS